MTKKEAILQKEILSYLEAVECPAYNIIIASKSGVSDIIACVYGKFCAIEVKVGNNTASELQKVKQYKVVQAGGYAIIARSLEDVIQLRNRIYRDLFLTS